jgi:hypothetical protein
LNSTIILFHKKEKAEKILLKKKHQNNALDHIARDIDDTSVAIRVHMPENCFPNLQGSLNNYWS